MYLKLENISPNQFSILVLFYTIGSSILFLPATLTGVAHNDAWISSLISLIIGFFAVTFISKVGLISSNLSFVELSEKVLGRFIGKLVSILYLSFFFLMTTILIWIIGDFVKTQIMPETPLLAIYIIFTMISLYGCRLGIETIGRASEVFIPWVILLLLLMLISLFHEFELKNAFPILENGFIPILRGTYITLGLPLFELAVFLMIIPMVSDKTKVTKAFQKGFLFGSLCLFFVTVSSILVLGADFTERNTFPVYTLGKKVAIIGLLERIEVFVAVIWFLGIYFKLTISMYACLQGISKLLKLQDYRSISLPFGVLVAVASLVVFPSFVTSIVFLRYSWIPLTILVGFFLPLTILVVDFAKKRKNKKSKIQARSAL